MGKKKEKGAAAKSAALTPEEFQKLTPEEQIAYFTSLTAEAEEAKQQAADANQQVEKLKKAKKSDAPAVAQLPTIEVDEDDDLEIEGGEYEFTCKSFIWDDNRDIQVKDLVADFEGSDKKKAAKASEIIAKLLQRKSGLLRRKED